MTKCAMLTKETKESILEIQVDAALAGHDLGPFEEVKTFEGARYQAGCRLCDLTAWIGDLELMYSLLADRCSKSPEL